MPRPSSPPYYDGAVNPVRTINRWLDVNAQNGALTRAKAFIELPVFSIDYVWDGYSDLIGAFNFEAPNGFSLPTNRVVAERTLPVVYNVITITEVVPTPTPTPTPTPEEDGIAGVEGGSGDVIV